MEFIRRGKDIIINPKVHKRTLIWMHGLGDSAEGFLPVFSSYKLIDKCRFVLLTAPIRPVTLNYGEKMNSWYDIVSLDKREMNDEAVESAETVKNEIETQRKDVNDIYIGGFSQGGALSLYTGLSYISSPVKAIIGVSCYAMNYAVKNELKHTPVFLYHGKSDMVVSHEMAEKSYKDRLEGVNYKLVSEYGLGHGVSPRCLSEIKKWVESI